MPSNRNVAIDGPVASGKTVTAKRLAAELGHLYLDTGAMYRAVAYIALKKMIDLDAESALVTELGHHQIRVVPDASAMPGYRVFIDGEDTASRLFDPDVAAAVSTVAAQPRIRERMVTLQREIAGHGPVVMAGRDIGTVVLPDASHKFFLTATPEERARRRRAEFAERGIVLPLEEVLEQVRERDRLDTTRAVAPLRAADDAHTIDSTALTEDDVVARMRALIEAAA